MSKRILNFSDEVNIKLKELKQDLQMPINKIITMIINEKLEDLKILKKDYIENIKSENIENKIQIKFRINENEKIFLEEQIKKTGNGSLTSEIRYRLVNTMYKNKYFLPIELENFNNLNNQVKKVGNNINQISRKLNSNKDLNNSDYINLLDNINKINLNINQLTNEIKDILKFAEKRD